MSDWIDARRDPLLAPMLNDRFRMTRQFSAGVACALTLGAALMYLLDPAQGRRRRALVRDKGRRLARLTEEGVGTLSRDVSNRLSGLKARASGAGDASVSDDEVVLERVRAEIGHHVSHARAIDVDVRDGHVCLCGPILTDEADRILQATRQVRGVRSVEDQLERHDSADIPSLQGGRTVPSWMQRRWSPTTRALAGAGALAGVTLAVVTMSRQSRSRTAHAVDAADNWDPAGFA